MLATSRTMAMSLCAGHERKANVHVGVPRTATLSGETVVLNGRRWSLAGDSEALVQACSAAYR